MSVEEMVSKEGKDSRGYESVVMSSSGISPRTPLQIAAEKEQLEIVQFLVKTCPTVDLIGQTNSTYGSSSLHCAAMESNKNVQTLQFLIDNYNGKDIKDIINQKSNWGRTPLDNAYGSTINSPIRKDIVALLRQFGGKRSNEL